MEIFLVKHYVKLYIESYEIKDVVVVGRSVGQPVYCIINPESFHKLQLDVSYFGREMYGEISIYQIRI